MSEVNLDEITELGNTEAFIRKNQEERERKEKERIQASKKRYIEFDEKHYLNTQLPKNVTEKTVTVRILPFNPKSGNYNFCQQIKSHLVRFVENGQQKFKYYPCLKHNVGFEHLGYGTECPFCTCSDNTQKALKEEKNEEKRKLYIDMLKTTRLYDQWLLRVIDRDNEADGPKIWRFNDSSTYYNMLVKLWETRKNETAKYEKIDNYDIFNTKDGKDLNLNIISGLRSDGVRTTKISSITDVSVKTPLSDDVELMKSWINDEKEWWHLFPPKPYGYLYIRMGGGNPMLVPGTQIWSNKNEYDLIKSQGGKPLYSEEEEKWVDGTDVLTPSMTEGEIAGSSLFNQEKENGQPLQDDGDELPF